MFDFEKLDAYRLALELCEDIEKVLRSIPRTEYVFIDQLKRAALSIPLNIAEGCGRKGDGERRQFFYISRGSAFECVPILTLLEKKQLLSSESLAALREKLTRVVQMLTKLAQSFDRARETCT